MLKSHDCSYSITSVRQNSGRWMSRAHSQKPFKKSFIAEAKPPSRLTCFPPLAHSAKVIVTTPSKEIVCPFMQVTMHVKQSATIRWQLPYRF